MNLLQVNLCYQSKLWLSHLMKLIIYFQPIKMNLLTQIYHNHVARN